MAVDSSKLNSLKTKYKLIRFKSLSLEKAFTLDTLFSKNVNFTLISIDFQDFILSLYQPIQNMLVTLDIPEQKVPFMMELLQSLDFMPKNGKKLANTHTESIEQGLFKIDEKPSDFAGLWKNEKRDLKQLRAAAWKQRN